MKAYTTILICALLTIFISACDSQSVAEQVESEIDIDVDADVSFATNRDTYLPGNEVQISLVNGSRLNLGYNICYAFVEMEASVDATWRSTEPGPGPDPDTAVGCTTELRNLQPEGTAESIIFLPIDVAPGEYRLTHDIEVNRRRYTVATNTFEVERP